MNSLGGFVQFVVSPDTPRRIAGYAVVAMIATMAAFLQSYFVLRLGVVALFAVASLVAALLARVHLVYPRLLTFYLATAVLGIVWSIYTLLQPGNFSAAGYDALRLYGLWSLVFIVLFSLMRALPSSLHWVHWGMVTAAILISSINLFALADQVAGLGAIPSAVREEMELYVGIHEGYIQITSNNIGPLFLIVPYLMSLQFHSAHRYNGRMEKMALLLALVITAACGRRALWLVVGVSPCVMLVLTMVSGGYFRIPVMRRRMLWTYVAGVVVAGATLLTWPSGTTRVPTVDRLKEAFSAQDERTIQQPYLVRGFLESPIIGAGLGAYAGYPRNDERPWTYELTYHQMLFNMGIVGTTLIAALMIGYFLMVLRLIRASTAPEVPFGLLLALTTLLLGSYTNPYVRSFDFLFFIGLLPFLSTFMGGFEPALKPVRSEGA